MAPPRKADAPAEEPTPEMSFDQAQVLASEAARTFRAFEMIHAAAHKASTAGEAVRQLEAKAASLLDAIATDEAAWVTRQAEHAKERQAAEASLAALAQKRAEMNALLEAEEQEWRRRIPIARKRAEDAEAHFATVEEQTRKVASETAAAVRATAEAEHQRRMAQYEAAEAQARAALDKVRAEYKKIQEKFSAPV